MAAVALALGASLAWGVSDFLAGLTSRRAGTLAVTVLTQLVGVALAAAWTASSGDPRPDGEALALGLGAGLAVVLGLGAFYHGLAIGTMSVVAPITATGVVLPVVIGMAGGDDPSAAQASGIVAATVGVILATRARHDDTGRTAAARRSITLALIAALGTGFFLWLMRPASRESVPWALLLARGAAAPLFLIAIAAARAPLRPALELRAAAGILVIGVLGFAATAQYAAATRHGLLSIVAVLGSLYPAVTVLLARGVLGERLRPLQKVGVVAVLAGVPLIAAG